MFKTFEEITDRENWMEVSWILQFKMRRSKLQNYICLILNVV
jgi:hypothetical protein